MISPMIHKIPLLYRNWTKWISLWPIKTVQKRSPFQANIQKWKLIQWDNAETLASEYNPTTTPSKTFTQTQKHNNTNPILTFAHSNNLKQDPSHFPFINQMNQKKTTTYKPLYLRQHINTKKTSMQKI